FNTEKLLVVELNASDAEKAKQSQERLKAGLDFGLDMLATTLLPAFSKNPQAGEMVRAGTPLVEDLKNGVSVTQEGQRVMVTAKLTPKGRESLAGLVSTGMGAVEKARTAAKRAQRANEMRMASLGAMNFVAANGRLPANVLSPEGTPRLSWRA